MTSDYGTYRLAFEPPADQITPSVEMTLSGEADVSQMLDLFESFLQAAGYVLKGDLKVIERAPDYSFSGPVFVDNDSIDFSFLSSNSDDLFSFGDK
jgi:hypothetical protein